MAVTQRDVARGRVFDDPKDARDAAHRAGRMLGAWEGDLLDRHGWRVPVGWLLVLLVLQVVGVAAFDRTPGRALSVLLVVGPLTFAAYWVVLRQRRLVADAMVANQQVVAEHRRGAG